jgi:hypothetical protein
MAAMTTCGTIDDFGMDTITLAGRWRPSCRPCARPASRQVMLKARDIVGHPDGLEAAVQAVKASGLRVTGFQVLRDFEGLSGHLHATRSTSPSPCWRCAPRWAAPLLLACSSTSVHATQDLDAIARDLRKLAMLAMPLGIKVAYEGLSWGRTINEFTTAWDVVCRADMPNLGLGWTPSTCSPPRPAGRAGTAGPRQDLPGAAGRLHVAGDPHGGRAHHHRPQRPQPQPAGHARARRVRRGHAGRCRAAVRRRLRRARV